MLLPPLLLQLPLLFMVEEDVTEPYGIFHAMPSAVKPVLDPESANDTAPIPGYERNKCVMYGAESTNHTLAWRGGNGTAAPPIEPGREVRLRFYWRDALIFAVGAN